MRPRALLIAVILITSLGAGSIGHAQLGPDDPPAPGAGAPAEPGGDAAATPPVEEDASDPGPAPQPFRDPNFGPTYEIEQVVVRGNRKTATKLILGEVGIVAGQIVTASDGRVEAARIHLLSLGFFLDVRLALERGARRGGAILVVDVEERGTIVLNALYLGESTATPFWGGLDLAENNLAGRGISLGAGFVAATRPDVAEARRALGVRVRAQVPPLLGTGLILSGTGIVTSGNEFMRVSGGDSDGDPVHFVALGIRRVGGVVGMGRALTRAARLFLDFREEGISSTWPIERSRLLAGGDTRPLDFGLRQGFSRVGSLTATLDFDTRSDPLVPRAGIHAALSAEAALEPFGSDYQFAKLVFQGSSYTPNRFGHSFGVHLFGGALFGDAPLFDRFFVGDMNLFLPPRALGMNFSTQPSPSFLGSAIARHRYDAFAARVLLEYTVPLWRRHGVMYRGDAFIAAGAFALGSSGNFRDASRTGLASWPIDLTGDLGVRLDTTVGVFTLSIANALGRVPFLIMRHPVDWMRARACTLLLAVAVLVAPALAHAEAVPERTVGLAFGERKLLVSVGLQDLFSPAARDRLTSGFATRVLVRIQLSRQHSLEPVAIAFQRIEIVYDIWDERFRVRTTHGAGSDRAYEVKTIDEAFLAAATLINVPIELAEPLLPGERYTLAFRGDLNPLSSELMGEVRRWLRQPAGAQPRPGAGRGDSFFGTFVTVFVNPQIEDSERQLRFLSQSFEVPRR